MDTIRDAQLQITTNERPFRFLSMSFTSKAQVSLVAGAEGTVSLTMCFPSNDDLRKIIKACEMGLQND